MGRHEAIPPKITDGVEGYLFGYRAAKAARTFLQGNPEGGQKTLPSFHQVMAGADHLLKYPGDIPLFEGHPDPQGRHRALSPEQFKGGENLGYRYIRDNDGSPADITDPWDPDAHNGLK
jgi:hypothetical protein